MGIQNYATSKTGTRLESAVFSINYQLSTANFFGLFRLLAYLSALL
jgi:hypothetical protein